MSFLHPEAPVRKHPCAELLHGRQKRPLRLRTVRKSAFRADQARQLLFGMSLLKSSSVTIVEKQAGPEAAPCRTQWTERACPREKNGWLSSERPARAKLT